MHGSASTRASAAATPAARMYAGCEERVLLFTSPIKLTLEGYGKQITARFTAVAACRRALEVLL